MGFNSSVSRTQTTLTPTGASSPTIVRLSLDTVGIEYNYVLPAGTKQFLLRVDLVDVHMSYVAGESASNYVTIPRCCCYAESDLLLATDTTIYLQSGQPAQIVELLIWA